MYIHTYIMDLIMSTSIAAVGALESRRSLRAVATRVAIHWAIVDRIMTPLQVPTNYKHKEFRGPLKILVAACCVYIGSGFPLWWISKQVTLGLTPGALYYFSQTSNYSHSVFGRQGL